MPFAKFCSSALGPYSPTEKSTPTASGPTYSAGPGPGPPPRPLYGKMCP
jgi:hypothetical protein